jgi:drug/metabolite transporter (DMT)-like permease
LTTTQQHVGPSARRLTWRADLALVVAAFFWGTTFVIVKDAVDRVTPLAFLGVRFLVGAAVLAVVARSRPATPHELRHGVAAGMALLAGFALQTFGIQHTDPATSAFLTYLLVVFVPILGFMFLRKPLHPATGVGIGLALIGLVLLTGGAGGSFGRGEALTLGCAVCFAVHILILGQTATRHDTLRFTCIQVGTVGVVASLLGMIVDGPGELFFGGTPLAAAAFCGVAATAAAFFLMVWAQRSVSPSRAALILLLEPVFAALLSWLSGDALTLASAAGGLLILVAVGVAELVPNLLTHRSR